MTKNPAFGFLRSLPVYVGAGLALGLCSGLGTTSACAQDAVRLLPYKGFVAGELLCLIDPLTFQIEAWGQSEAPTCSNHLGVGVQRYDGEEVTVAINADGFLVAEGRARTMAANGDELATWFVLRAAFDPGDPFRELQYEGTYWVLEDGTGRFDYPNGLPFGALGSGRSVDGVAVLQPVPAPAGLPLFSLNFANAFEGTLAEIEPGRGKRK
ncbi:MAG: hypothetical protein H7A45_19495 [Verrucomicrobiales bacterium]|nr:hypothetical protein [Verrucomicrobiales bacterium]